MRRVGLVSSLLLTLTVLAPAAKPKKAAKPTAAPAAKSAAPVAVDHLGPIAALFSKEQVLGSGQIANLVSGIEGLSLECGAGCTPVFTALKVQNRTPRYLAVQLRQEIAAAGKARTSTWLLSFGTDGKRAGARQIEGRESADGQQSGVRSTFAAPDRFEVKSWSSFEPAAKEATLSEATPEKFRIAEDGRIVEEAAGK